MTTPASMVPRLPARTPAHRFPGSDQRVDGLADEVADTPTLAGADESANELDVVDPGASREMERPERRWTDGRLETSQVVLPDEGDALVARRRVACHVLGLADFLPRHAEPEVSGASEADVDAGLLAERLGEGIVEVAAQPGEDGDGIAPRGIRNRQDPGGRARGLGPGLRPLDHRDAEPGAGELVRAGRADRTRPDDDSVGPAQLIRSAMIGGPARKSSIRRAERVAMEAPGDAPGLVGAHARLPPRGASPRP